MTRTTGAGLALLGLGALYTYRLSRWAQGFAQAARATDALPPLADADLPVVTVVIPARDEEATIGPCVDSVLAGDYPPEKLDVIVVDDDSSDRTAAVVEARARGDERLRVVRIPENRRRTTAHKKRAIEKAIGVARGTVILTTDADCTVPPGWVRAMMAPLADPAVSFVSGPVRYELGARPSLFIRVQAMDFFGLMAIGGGGIALGRPNLANGANVAYRRRVFERLGGFSGIDHVASGDDELLMQKMAYGTEGPEAVRFCADPAALVLTAPAPTLRALVHQRKRWASKTTNYTPALQRMLLGVGAFLGGTVAATLALPLAPGLAPWLAGAYGLKAAGELTVLVPAARRFGHTAVLWAYPAHLVLHAPATLLAAALGPLGQFEWKGRVLER